MRAVMFDLEGTLHIGERPIAGAAEAVQAVRESGLACRFLTNVTTLSVGALHARLLEMGFAIEQEEVLSAPQAAVRHLRAMGSPRCLLLLREEVVRDFAEFPVSEADPEVIVVGDIGNRWNADLMQRLFVLILGGAKLVTLHKGKYWEAGDGLRIDIGAFVAALEFASGREATVVGKPSREFFRIALDSLGVAAEQVVMVGDDLATDVGAAQGLGMKGVLVKTGKYRPEMAERAHVRADAVLDSVRALPLWLAAQGSD